MTNTVLAGAVTQTISAFSTVHVCGVVQYTLTTSETFITFDATTLIITVEPTLDSEINTHSVDLIATLVDYPLITTTVTFKVIVNPCLVTSVTGVNDVSDTSTTIPITIFDVAYPVTLATYTQTPACGYLPVINLLGK